MLVHCDRKAPETVRIKKPKKHYDTKYVFYFIFMNTPKVKEVKLKIELKHNTYFMIYILQTSLLLF